MKVQVKYIFTWVSVFTQTCFHTGKRQLGNSLFKWSSLFSPKGLGLSFWSATYRTIFWANNNNIIAVSLRVML